MGTRFGILGTGFWADECHAAGLGSHPDTDLIGIWGRDAERATTLAERHGVRAESDLDALLESVDAVAIAVAPAAQPELAIRAAEAGCHLLLEKPLALSTGDAGRVVAAVERSGVRTLTNFSLRFAEPGASWLKAAAEDEWEGCDLTLLAAVLTAGSPYASSRWRREEGAALWDAAPHALSLILPLLGPVREVTAVPGRGETLHLGLGHEGGSVSSTTVSLTVSAAAARFDFELWGQRGTSTYPAPESNEQTYARAVSELVGAIEAGVPTACDIEFSAEVVRVLARVEACLAGACRHTA